MSSYNKGLNPNFQNKAGNTLAILAIENNLPQLAHLIVNDPRFDPNKQNKIGDTAAMTAFIFKQPSTADIISKNPLFNPHLVNRVGLTTGTYGIHHGFDDSFRLIIEHPL